jgi:hypothetical protein
VGASRDHVSMSNDELESRVMILQAQVIALLGIAERQAIALGSMTTTLENHQACIAILSRAAMGEQGTQPTH